MALRPAAAPQQNLAAELGYDFFNHEQPQASAAFTFRGKERLINPLSQGRPGHRAHKRKPSWMLGFLITTSNSPFRFAACRMAALL